MPTLPESPLRRRHRAPGYPPPGALIGGYTLAQPIAASLPDSAVFKARSPDGSWVALQILLSALSSDGAFRRRFRRLARARAAIDHPRVVPVVDAGQSRHGLYVAFASYPTATLGQLLEQQAPETSLTMTLLEQTASALVAAHAHGLVHDDLTPRAIGLDDEGALLADFGIAVAEHGRDGGWLDLRYAAPEQHLGRPLTARSNVYSLACILYHCLTGAPPFGAVTGLSQLSLPRPRVTDRRPDLPASIDSVVGIAMAKLPQRRYATAAELAAAARRALDSGEGPEWDEVAPAINAGTRLDLADRQPKEEGADSRPSGARRRLGSRPRSDAGSAAAAGHAEEPAPDRPHQPETPPGGEAAERDGTERTAAGAPAGERAAERDRAHGAEEGRPEPTVDGPARGRPAERRRGKRATEGGGIGRHGAEPGASERGENGSGPLRRAIGALGFQRRASSGEQRTRPGVRGALAIALVAGAAAAGVGGYLAGRAEPGSPERARPPSLDPGQSAAVSGNEYFSRTVDTAVRRLDAERMVTRRRLSSATTPARQAAAASRLARAYDAAAGDVASVAALAPAGPRFLMSLRAAESAYARLAAAARRGRRDAFARSRAAVQAAERNLEETVLELRGG